VRDAGVQSEGILEVVACFCFEVGADCGVGDSAVVFDVGAAEDTLADVRTGILAHGGGAGRLSAEG